MNAQPSQPQTGRDATEISALHQQLLEAWNKRSAADFTALFADEGNMVGFDGSQINGRAEIEAHLGQIFADHPTAAYVGKIRKVDIDLFFQIFARRAKIWKK